MLNFEEKKIVEYVLNCCAKRDYIKQFNSNISNWFKNNLNCFFPNPGKNNFKKGTADADFDSDDLDFDDEETVSKNDKGMLVKHKNCLKKLLQKPISKKISIIERNIELLQECVKLDDIEKEILGVIMRIEAGTVKKNIINNLFPSNLFVFKKIYYCLPYKESVIVNKLKPHSTLIETGILELDYRMDIDINQNIFNLLLQNNRSTEDIKKYIMGKPVKAKLNWEDFAHIEQKDLCKNLLKNMLKKSIKGANILFYGHHGCGKTEFAKVLINQIGSLGYIVENDNQKNSRVKDLLFAQKMLENDKNNVLLIDECDDIFNGWCNEKFFINKLLEKNTLPCIYIINSIHSMDKAYLRRFTHIVKFEMPDLDVRTKMWQKGLEKCKFKICEDTAQYFAKEYKLSPSFIDNAIKCAKLAGGGLNTLKQNLTALETAYNNGFEIKHNIKPNNPKDDVVQKTPFNTSLLNTDLDLSNLTERICSLKEKSFSLCLYGVSGTGKSAYAEYLAERLKMPIIKKKCSDLMSKYVGENEANIAEAFKKAKDDGAVLLFDEADSFLQDRTNAQRNWEITQVNEMLTQMEAHPYPFICTTNLISSIDQACLRRFIFKVEYKHLTAEQNTLAFEHFFNFKNIDLSQFNSLTPGDFSVVHKKATILGLLDNKEELIAMLKTEIKNKSQPTITRKIGFI